MNRARQIFAAISLLHIAAPALADNLRMPENYLQPAKWYHHPPEIQLINTDPTVREFRTPPEQTIYNINVGPPPQNVIHQVNINAAPPIGLSPDSFTSSKPGFTSNISPQSSVFRTPAKTLPSGQRMGSLPALGSLLNQSKSKTIAHAVTPQTPQTKGQTPTLTYKTDSHSGSSNLAVEADAHGKLLK